MILIVDLKGLMYYDNTKFENDATTYKLAFWIQEFQIG